MAGHGGARKGAGRPKGSRKSPSLPGQHAATPPAPKLYDSAEDYLEAVVTGAERPDRDRIAAAKAMLPYQIAKKRNPLKSEAPKQMALSEELEQEKLQAEEWQRRSEAVRLRLVGK